MNTFGFLFTLANAVLLLRLPRQWAALPLLLGSLYLSTGQTITGMRLLIAVGFVRVLIRHERVRGGFIWLDRLMILWGVCAVASSLFHSPFSGALVSRLGLVYNGLGTYLLMRTFIQSADEFLQIVKPLLLLLIPLAAGLLIERATGHNAFTLLGAAESTELRGGKIRAQGPFGHPILAGTAGAVCVPLALLYWQRNRKLALAGLAASVGIILATHSSGPIMTTLFVLGALGLWKLRQNLPVIRWAAIFVILALAAVMKDPVYYLLARIDLTGSSTGWHRAALIESAINHFGEWWLAGTDVTRHWMATGIYASLNHTDITNVYIMMGVIGGLPLMVLFMSVLGSGFAHVGRALRQMQGDTEDEQFVVWTLGAILFGHAMTFVSVDYFDQTVVLYYMALAAVASIQAEVASRSVEALAEAPTPESQDFVEMRQAPW